MNTENTNVENIEKNRIMTEELKVLATPLVKFLRDNYDSHYGIVIDFDSVRVVSDVIGTDIDN